MTDFQVPCSNGISTLTVSPGRPLFIIGRNGTGKSALVQSIQRQSIRRVIYLPGNRTSIFDGEGLSLTTFHRKQLTNNFATWDSAPDTRWRNVSGNSRNERAIHDLTVAENQYKSDLANLISSGVDVETSVNKLQAKESPLDRVNLIFEQANMRVRMEMVAGELRATQAGEALYSFARMSDGERIALILIAEVVAAKDGTVFVIDEPELHLHRSIVVSLISSLIKTRHTCEFVISTHELDLPTSTANAQVCIVRSVKWAEEGSAQSWDIDLIGSTTDLPEELKIDVLGSRRVVLFTEGTDQSLDVPMYSILFPNISVRNKGGCREVRRAVSGLRSTNALHHTSAYGLIDNDGMSMEEISNDQANGVYALPVFSVEALYYDEDVLKAVAKRQAATLILKKDDRPAFVKQYLDDLTKGVISSAEATGAAEHLAGRVAERQVRDAFIGQMPRRDDLITASSAQIHLQVPSPYPAEFSRLKRMIQEKNVHAIIARYPVRHSKILFEVAKALKFQNREDYEAAALTCISADAILQKKLRDKLQPLSEVLNG